MSDITQTIKDKLAEIERTENVRILYACESGSRAWGFASEDSDYDVRFVYVRPLDFYLRLDKTHDVIEYELTDVYDINGWDLQKLLLLLAKSNPVIYEWADSPIVYRTSDEWEKVKALLGDYFRMDKMLYHYISMCKNNIRTYFQGDEVLLKKYLYVLRPFLACEWIMTKHCPPPTDFNVLCEAVLPKEFVRSADRLLSAKKNSTEKQTGHHLEDLDHYIHNKIAETEFFLVNEDADRRNVDWERLNDVFLKVVFYGRQ